MAAFDGHGTLTMQRGEVILGGVGLKNFSNVIFVILAGVAQIGS